jgi:hypothetical protein
MIRADITVAALEIVRPELSAAWGPAEPLAPIVILQTSPKWSAL